ncbi:SDR family NAD(P)-dependent oxidoreductase [Lactococcus fujiensis]|uniref:SDR family NAD(P)-dependent oxidoreductase n=1 Tax=Lactococcus fujiensis TaxID=610251 RepID=UPI0025B1DAC4|nr:SDR family NAD(P)-dependent oxidoreductase [Lactococcus fujiensis]
MTGASNGMGLEAAKLFASKGWHVIAGARRVEKIPVDPQIMALKLDVTDHDSNVNFVESALAKTGRIDVLVNNAGYGEYGPAEEIPMSLIRKQFETNFFGAVELTQLVLPTMRAQKFGRIVNISSIGGDVYMPLGAYYHATKAALQQWSDVLNLEVEPFGIRSICIQPGGTQSSWGNIAFENAKKNLAAQSPYLPLVEAVSAGMESFMKNAPTSADLAKIFYKAATDVKPQLRYFNAFSDKVMVKVARHHQKLFYHVMRRMIKHFEQTTKNLDQ